MTLSKPAQAALPVSEKRVLELRDGDLCVMGGRCQKTHKHDLPKVTGQLCGRRINATFRSFRSNSGGTA